MAQVRAININLSPSSTMVNTTRSLRLRRPRVQHAIRVAVLLRRPYALRSLRYTNALSAATPADFQPRSTLQGFSVGNVQLQFCLADHLPSPKPGHTTDGSGGGGASAEPGQAAPEGTSMVWLAQETSVPLFHLSSPKTGHTTGRSGWVEAVHGGERGVAKLGRSGCRHFGRPRSQPSL